MKKKILVADDDSDTRYMLQLLLDHAGYEVECLNEGASLVERSGPWPDLFILDRNMPMLDGLALCKYLRFLPETKNIPILMISADPFLEGKARRNGADACIEKPFSGQQLLRMVDSFLGTRSAQA
jgi:two-component system alkaline phosphatase synthesis response regulator PhoP